MSHNGGKVVRFVDYPDVVPPSPPSSRAPMVPGRLHANNHLQLDLGPPVALPETYTAAGGAVEGQSTEPLYYDDSPSPSASSWGSADSYPINAPVPFDGANYHPNNPQGYAAPASGGRAYFSVPATHSNPMGVFRSDTQAVTPSSALSKTPSPPPPTSLLIPTLRNFPHAWDVRNGNMPRDNIFEDVAFLNHAQECVLAFRPPVPGRLGESISFEARVKAPVDGLKPRALYEQDILVAIQEKLHENRNASFIEPTRPYYKAAVAARASRGGGSSVTWRRVDLWPAAPHLYFLGLEPNGHEKDGTMIYVVKLGMAPPPKDSAL